MELRFRVRILGQRFWVGTLGFLVWGLVLWVVGGTGRGLGV